MSFIYPYFRISPMIQDTLVYIIYMSITADNGSNNIYVLYYIPDVDSLT